MLQDISILSPKLSNPLSEGVSFPVSRSTDGLGILYGMWFDGSNDKVLFDGSPFNTKTKGRITGSFQTSSSGYHNIWSLTDETDTGADVSVYLNGGKFYLTVRTAPGVNIIYAHTDAATFADGANHTFDVQVDASGNTIKVDGVTQAVTYVAGNSSTVGWADDVDDIDILSVGIRQESTPDGVFDGVVRDLILYDEDGTTPLWSVNGYGNTDADWADLSGNGNNGTVAGSPSRAVSEDSGATWAEEPAAAGYLWRLSSQGVAVTGAQSSAIHTFFLTGESEGWLSLLKRMYLPIWEAAAPNAIDMIGGTSGAWVGGSGVTHAAGYAKGDGSTGRFDFGISPYSLGLTRNTSTIGCLVAVVPTQTGRLISVQTGSTPLQINMVTSSIIRTNSFDLAVLDGSATSYASAGGVWVLSRTTSTSVKLFQLDDAGSSEDANTATSDNVNITHNLTGMARNNSGSYSAYSDAGFGAFFAATGMTDAQATNFMAATRTLWETATGLSLP